MSEEPAFCVGTYRYIDEQERYRWFKRQAIVCQGCLNLDWYYTQRCVLGKIPCDWNHCCWLRVEAVIVKGLEVGDENHRNRSSKRRHGQDNDLCHD